MSEVQRSRGDVHFEQALQRCPFCHESIAVESDAWVACGQCLGRHHAACWGEAGRCGACQHGVALSPADVASGPPAGAVLGVVPEAAADRRRETARAFEKAEGGERWLAALVLAPLTLGLYPILRSEADLREHQRRNAAELPPIDEEDPDLRARLVEAHARAGSSGFGARLRTVLPPLLMLVALVTFTVACGTYNTLSYPSSYTFPGFNATDPVVRDAARAAYQAASSEYWAQAGACQVLMFLAGWLYPAALFAHLHAFREAVRRHEREQLFARLVGSGAAPEASERLLREGVQAWNVRRILDALLTVAVLVPGLGVLVAWLASVRIPGALAQHAVHEERAEAICPAKRAPREPS